MRSITILLGTCFVLLLAGTHAHACSCVHPGPPCENYGRAAAVFVGTVIRVGDGKPAKPDTVHWGVVTYKFSVEQAYSGVSGTEVEVSTGSGFGDCGYNFQAGQRYLVYAYEEKNGLSTSICTRTKPFERANEDLAFLGTLSSLARGVTLFGEIRHPSIKGKFDPSEASVTIEDEGQRKEVRPDAEGDFRVDGLNPGTIKVRLNLPDKLTASPAEQELNVTDRGCARAVWYVEDNGRISGRVLTAEGLPVAKIDVSLVPLSDPEAYAVSKHTNEEGQFAFGPIEPGRYLLVVNRTPSSDRKDPTNAYAPTYYPGVTDEAHARVIILEVGQKLSDLVIRVGAKR